MPNSRDFYRITGNTTEEMRNELNYIFQRLMDRLDKAEGLRGTISPVFSDVSVGGEITLKDENDTVLHSFTTTEQG